MKKLIVICCLCGIIFSCNQKNEKTNTSVNQNQVEKNEKNTEETATSEKTTEEEIREMVELWNNASSNGDLATLESILADKIEYYQSTVTRDYYIKDQKKFFEKNPVYGQVIKGDIDVEKISDTQYKATFVKEVTSKNGVNEYPSYLVFRKNGDEWKLVLESDKVSDQNLKKQKSTKAKEVESSEEAYKLVRASIIKHDLADINCIMTLENGEDANYYYFEIRTDNEKCDGDSNVASRLFGYQVNKKTGKLKTDSYEWFKINGRNWADAGGEYISID